MEHVRAGAEEAGRDPADAIKLSLLTAMWVGDDQEEAWDSAAGRPPPARTTSPTRCSRNPEHGMPETMTRLGEAATSLRLLRRPSRLGRRPHRLPDRRADRRLRARGPAEQGAREGAGPLRARDRRDLVRVPERLEQMDAPRDHRPRSSAARSSGSPPEHAMKRHRRRRRRHVHRPRPRRRGVGPHHGRQGPLDARRPRPRHRRGDPRAVREGRRRARRRSTTSCTARRSRRTSRSRTRAPRSG